VSDGYMLYRDLAYVFGAAVVGGLGARLLRQPLILGYVAGGILIGPFTPGPRLSNIHELELLAEIGVILLMYSIGIEFSPRDLLPAKWISLGAGPLGILLCIALGLGAGWAMGWSPSQGIAVGAAVSVASTMVLSRLLIDSKQLHSEHGRAMIGMTLVEDFAVVILTILLPSLTALSGERFFAVALSMGKAALIIAPFAVIAVKLVPPLLAKVAEMQSQELFLLVAVALGFVTAAATQALGLSLALGAFLAGMMVSGSPYAHQTLSHLLPLRDVFVALFFVTIGALVDPKVVWTHPGLLLALLALILVGKGLIWTAVALLFRYPVRTALLIAAGLTQIGEFSYVLIQVAREAKMVDPPVYNAILMASLISILVNVLLMRFASARWTSELAPAADALA
jgi:CPA2 family monovalent cation:H+ antiporter-2